MPARKTPPPHHLSPCTHLRAGDRRRLRCSSRFAIDHCLGNARTRRLDLRSMLNRRRTVPIGLSSLRLLRSNLRCVVGVCKFGCVALLQLVSYM